MALRLAQARKEEWAVQMKDLSEAVKCQARIYDEMCETTKTDWLTKKLEFKNCRPMGKSSKLVWRRP